MFLRMGTALQELRPPGENYRAKRMGGEPVR